MSAILEETGHVIATALVFAALDDRLLSPDNFTRVSTHYGYCFMFNLEELFPGDLKLNKAGFGTGLHMWLLVEQEEYYYNEFWRVGAGFQVHVFQKGTHPAVAHQGFSIAPGTSTGVAMEMKVKINSRPPHGQCRERKLKYYDRYGKNECEEECFHDWVIMTCGCKLSSAPVRVPGRECDPYVYLSCTIIATHKFSPNDQCDCPTECLVTTYEPSLSFMAFPSNFWERSLTNFFDENLNSSNNMCELHVYFKSLTIETTAERPAYSFFALLSDIGGSLGLWLGASILTLYECIDLLVHSFYVYSKHAQKTVVSTPPRPNRQNPKSVPIGHSPL